VQPELQKRFNVMQPMCNVMPKLQQLAAFVEAGVVLTEGNKCISTAPDKKTAGRHYLIKGIFPDIQN